MSPAATSTATPGISGRLGAFSTLLPASLLEKGVDFLTQEVKRLQEEELPSDESEAAGIALVVDFPPTVISFATPQPSVAGATKTGSTTSREGENDSSGCSSSSMGEEGGFLCLDDALSLDAASTLASHSVGLFGPGDSGEPHEDDQAAESSYYAMQLLLRKRQSLLRHPPSSIVGADFSRYHQQDLHNHSTSASDREGRAPHESFLHTLSGTVLNPNAPPVPRMTSQHMGFVKNLRREEKEEYQQFKISTRVHARRQSRQQMQNA